MRRSLAGTVVLCRCFVVCCLFHNIHFSFLVNQEPEMTRIAHADAYLIHNSRTVLRTHGFKLLNLGHEEDLHHAWCHITEYSVLRLFHKVNCC